MQHSTSSKAPATKLTFNEEPVDTSKVDAKTANEIIADMRSIKNPVHGTQGRLHEKYGMSPRELNSVSVDIRSGFTQDAFNTLLRAHQSINKVH